LACTALVSVALSGKAWAAQTTPATPKTLAARIASAKTGETILLSSGDYGPLAVNNQKFPGAGVTVQAQPGAKAVFTSIGVSGSEGLTLKDFEVKVVPTTPGAVVFGVSVNGSTRVVLTGLRIYGPPGPPAEEANGILLRNDMDVTVQDSDLRQLGTGVNYIDSDHVELLRNTVSDIRTDGFRGGSSHVDVIGNHGSNFHPIPGDHPDFIQFWSTPSGRSTGNRIKDNVYERGERGGGVQGVFIEDNRDIVISGNALVGTMYNAISMSRVQGAIVENNFVQGYPDMGVEIITRGGSSDVTIHDNVAPMIESRVDEGKPNTGYKEQGNRKIAGAKQGDTAAMQAWLAKKGAR
jgi:hypothetical protein